jgi:hypothetical protein
MKIKDFVKTAVILAKLSEVFTEPFHKATITLTLRVLYDALLKEVAQFYSICAAAQVYLFQKSRNFEFIFNYVDL